MSPESAEPTRLDRRSFLQCACAGAVLATLPSCARYQARRPRTRWTAVEALIQRYLAEGKYPGAIAGLSYGGSPPQYVSSGTLAFDSPQRVDEDSLWRIKSMTKQVTGVATMMLIEDGVLALDQPVAEILPALRSMRVAIDPETSLASRPAERLITIRHLLTHTSGFSYWIPSAGEGLLPRAYRERGITPGNYYPAKLDQPGYGPQARGLAEMVARLAELPLAFEPGTAWRYSVGPDVLGAVIERITGGFGAFLQERLFTPLAMSSTGFQVMARNAARLTSNYETRSSGRVLLDPGPTSVFLRPPTLPAGGAGLVSSARDFMRFGLMLLHGGVLHGARVMRPETARLATSNLLPEGIISGAVISGARGFGAGGAVVLPGDNSPFGAPGNYGGGGAANTLWGLDRHRGGVWLFMSQHMPAERRPLTELPAAIDSDLRHG